MTTILVLINDLGLQFWLAEGLTEAGYLVLPAKTPSHARKLLAELSCSVDLAVVNPALVGVAGFLEDLRRSQGYLQVFSLAAHNERESKADWVRRIRKAVSFSASA